MAETDGAPPVARSRRFRRRRVALATALLLTTGLGIVWIERQPIVTHFIDRELVRRGVPARYRIEDIGLGRQRLTDVVIGDPRRPDLTADRLETQLGFGLNGPYLLGVDAGRVRLNAQLVDGRVSLGSIDRLLPPSSGKPFALPSLRVAVDDARIRLATPAGTVALRVNGRGRLNDGFAGTLAARAPRLGTNGCTATAIAADVAIRITAARPHLTGPVTAARLDCATLAVVKPRIDLDTTLSAALDRWRGSARIAAAAATQGTIAVATAGGRLDFAGTAARTMGHLDAIGRVVRSPTLAAAAVRLGGTYRIGTTTGFDGRAHLDDAALDRSLLARAATFRTAGVGTPVAPLLTHAADALAAAGRAFDVDVRLQAAGNRIALSHVMANTASGARLTLGDRIAVADGAIAMPNALTMIAGGGGLPRFSLSLSRARPTAPIHGRAIVDPYAAGTARLALTPVDLTATPGGAVRLTTRATLSGPLGDGRVDGLSMPLALAWNGRDRLTVNPACTPLAFDRLAVASLTLDPARLRLCPTTGALVQVAGGRVAGGARLATTGLTGRLGTTPLALTATGAALRLADRGFAIDGVAARLGPPRSSVDPVGHDADGHR